MSERTVLVRLKAAVSEYIRDMKTAGRETTTAFQGAEVATTRVGQGAKAASRDLSVLGSSAKSASGDVGALGGRVTALGDGAGRSGPQIDRLSGRLRILRDVILAIGPAAVPIAAVLAPALGGIAAVAGIAALAIGGIVAASQGVGKALDAVAKAEIDPTVENLEKARQALEDLDPAAAQFVLTARSELVPILKDIRDAGAAELFPGLTESIDSIELAAPRLEALLAVTGGTVGDLAVRTTQAFNTDRAEEFTDFLQGEIRPTLESVYDITSNLVGAATSMWQAFDPGNDRFLDSLVDVTDQLDQWAQSEEGRDDIAAFLDYAAQVGPQVADAFTATAGAAAAVVQAAAPLGGPVLQALESVARVVEAIASSEVGTPLLALAAGASIFSRASTAADALQSKVTRIGDSFTSTGRRAARLGGDLSTVAGGFAASAVSSRTFTADLDRQGAAMGRLRERASGLGKTIGVLGGLGVAATGVADSFGLTNTASLALLGTIAGPWGVAIGAGVGALLDLKSAGQEAADAQQTLVDALEAAGGALDQGVAEGLAGILQEEGLVDWAEDNGVALSELVSTVYAGEDAVESLRKRLGLPLGDAYIASLRGAARYTGEAREEAELAADVQGALADAVDRSSGAFGGMTPRAADLATKYADIAEQAAAAERETTRLQTALDRLLGEVSLSEGFVAYEESLDRLKASLKEGGSFNVETEQGQANLSNLYDMVRDTGQQFVDLKDAGQDLAAQRFLTGALADLREMRKSAGPAGRAEIDEYTGSLLELQEGFAGLPEKAQTEIVANGIPKTLADVKDLQRRYDLTQDQVETLAKFLDGPARAKLEAWVRRQNAIDGRVIRTTVVNTIRTVRETVDKYLDIFSAQGNYFPGTTKATRNAAGGYYPRGDDLDVPVVTYAGGGIDAANRHNPEFAGPGPIRVWREPETGGESYIPHANDDRRPRAKEIAEKTVALFGGDVTWHARGSLSASPDQRFFPTTATETRPGAAGGRSWEDFPIDRLAEALARLRPNELSVNSPNAESLIRDMDRMGILTGLGGGPAPR